ncbi:ATP-binding protein [Bacillus sp. JJ634]
MDGDEGITITTLDRLLHRVEVVHMNDDSYQMKDRQHIF